MHTPPRRKSGIQRLLQRCSERVEEQPACLQLAWGASEVPDGESRRPREQNNHRTCTRKSAAIKLNLEIAPNAVHNQTQIHGNSTV